MEKLPLYRTRLIWGAILSLVGLFMITMSYLLISNLSTTTFSQLLNYLLLITGGTTPALIGFKLLGEVGRIIFVVAYYCFVVFLLYSTFKNKRVEIKYPILILFLYFFSMILVSFSGF